MMVIDHVVNALEATIRLAILIEDRTHEEQYGLIQLAILVEMDHNDIGNKTRDPREIGCNLVNEVLASYDPVDEDEVGDPPAPTELQCKELDLRQEQWKARRQLNLQLTKVATTSEEIVT